jgi:hypothetical protein
MYQDPLYAEDTIGTTPCQSYGIFAYAKRIIASPDIAKVVESMVTRKSFINQERMVETR